MYATYITEKRLELRQFEFWGGAKDLAELLSDKHFETIEQYLFELYPNNDTTRLGECLTDTMVNDLFWFEEETIIKDILGFDDDEFQEWSENGINIFSDDYVSPSEREYKERIEGEPDYDI